MKRAVFLCCAAVAIGTTVRGGPIESAIIAAMKLREAANYQWVATVTEDSRFYFVEAKTRKDGYTLVSTPMVNSIQRKLGGGKSEIQTAIFRGNDEFVVQTPEGWMSRDELAELPSPGFGGQLGAGGARRPVRGGGSPAGFGGRGPRYSNLQVNLSFPHDELETIVGSYTEVRATTDGVEGVLSTDGAKLLLVHPGQDEITALRASGSFKLWLKDGAVSKYEVQLAGTLALGAGSNRREVSVNQSVTTELKDVGKTAFDVPEEAKRKLAERLPSK
jgi:hypothetical protein